MRILVLKPYAGETRELEHCIRIKRPDTEADFANIKDAYPITHVHHHYFKYKAVEPTIERIMLAEEQGYDGVLIACGGDPGLEEARELVNIPVVGTLEGACHIASMMGNKFSIVTPVRYGIPGTEELVRRYGFGPKLASIRALGIPGRKLYNQFTGDQIIVERMNEVARQCVEQDGAEVLVLTATLAGSMYTHAVKEPITEIGAPVVDALPTAFKVVELMVDLQKLAGLPPVSRVGAYRHPYEPEYREIRAYYGLPLRRGLVEEAAPVLTAD